METIGFIMLIWLLLVLLIDHGRKSNNKIYCVFIDNGSWDTHTYKLDKVFKNKEKAEEYIKEINDYYNNLKQLAPKDKSEEDDFDMENYEEYIKEYGKLRENFNEKYNITVYEVEEFNKCVIEEFKIN